MKYAHLIKLTSFSYENEGKDIIFNAFLRFFPFSLEENNAIFKKTEAIGFNEKKIVIFEVTLTKNGPLSQFMKNLLDNLDEVQRNRILDQAGSRLDKNLSFFLRFDKDSWINDRKLILTDSGRCFHLRINLAAFPKKREAALKLIHYLFSGK